MGVNIKLINNFDFMNNLLFIFSNFYQEMTPSAPQFDTSQWETKVFGFRGEYGRKAET